MGFNVTDEKAVEQSQEEAKNDMSGSGSSFIKYDEGDNLIALVSPHVSEGFVHYVKTGEQAGYYVPCQGGKSGKGFDTVNCKVCSKVKKLYAVKRRLQGEGKDDLADAVGRRAYDLRANLTYFWVAKKGRKVIKEDKEGNEKITVKYVSEPNDEGKTVPLFEQKLRMTSKHWLTVKSLVDDEKNPHLKKTADLLNYVLNFKKEKPSGKKRFGEIIPKATKIKINTEIDEKNIKTLLEENNKHIEPLEISSVDNIMKEYEDYWGTDGDKPIKGGVAKHSEVDDSDDEYESDSDSDSKEETWGDAEKEDDSVF